MKHIYQRPVITLDAGMAEGVYAASGASVAGNTSQITYSDFTTVADWGSGNGQAKFTINLGQLNNLSQLTVTITFNTDIENLWGSGASVSRTGNTASLYWYDAPKSAELFVQVKGTLQTVAIKSITFSNN